jgi:hypothetical protein
LIAIDCLPHQVTAKRGFSSDADLRRPLPCPSAPTATGAATAAVAVTTTAAATAAAAVEAETTGEAAALSASYASLHSSLPAAMREPELKSANDAVCNGAASCGEGRGHGDHGNGGDGGCCRTGGVDGGGPLASLARGWIGQGSPLVQGRWPTGSPTAKAPAQAEGEEEARDSSQEDVAFHQLALSAEAFALLAGLYRRISLAAAGGNVGGVVGGWVAAWEQLGLVLVPAAWLCVNMVPLMMVLAYARLPDSLPLSTL